MSTPCVGVPATYIIRPGRSLRECGLYVMGGTLHPRFTKSDHLWETNLCALSVLRLVIRRNVSGIDSWECCHHFLLVEGVRRHLSLVSKTQYCAVLVSRGGWYKVSLLLPLLPPSFGWWEANAVWSSCVVRPINSCQICSDARNIGFSQYNRNRFDMIHPVSVPIWYRSDNCPFSKCSYMECAGFCCSWYYGKLVIAFNHWSSSWYIYGTRAHISLSGYPFVIGYPNPGYLLTGLLDGLSTNQIAVCQVTNWSTHRLDSLQTGQTCQTVWPKSCISKLALWMGFWKIHGLKVD